MAGQTERPTHPITSSDTIALITNTVIPAIQGIQGDLKAIGEIKSEIAVINTKLENIEKDSKDLNETIQMLRVTLYGNGNTEKAGLVTLVATMKSWVDARSAIEKSVIAGMVVALFGEVAGFVYIALRLSALH